MHLKETVWEEMSIWEDLADISEFEYSDSEHETHEVTPDKSSAVTSTKDDDCVATVALSTTDSYQGCNWDVESCFGHNHLRYCTYRTEIRPKTQISKDKSSKATWVKETNDAKATAGHQRQMRYIFKETCANKSGFGR
jgi:hypothetical protein